MARSVLCARRWRKPHAAAARVLPQTSGKRPQSRRPRDRAGA